MAPMRAFSVFQKWPKIAKMTPNDLLTLEMVLTEPPKNTKQILFSFLKFIILVDLERKNEFHCNIATYRLYVILRNGNRDQ